MSARPMYESQADLTREHGVAQALESAWGCELAKLPIRYHLDYAVTRGGRVVGLCEIKTRNYTMQQIQDMGGYLLSVGKWTAAKGLADACNLPFALVVKASDGIWFTRFTTESFSPDGVLLRGRTDRGDWQDVEPCVVLDCNRFKPLQ